jgi:hypothetical protein
MRKIKSFPVFLIVLGFIILLDTTNAFEGSFYEIVAYAFDKCWNYQNS